jgi:phage protein gp29|nr:MAG TPA: nucelotide kinase [Caudoviricetes sp.]
MPNTDLHDPLTKARLEAVSHPEHYKGVYGLEAIEVMRNFLPKYQNSHVSYLIGNVIKYVLRAPSKGKEIEDLMKAREYLDLAIKELEGDSK